jgi:hypothetical protein
MPDDITEAESSTLVESPAVASPPPPVSTADWTALGFKPGEMEEFSKLISGNIHHILDSAQGFTFWTLKKIRDEVSILTEEITRLRAEPEPDFRAIASRQRMLRGFAELIIQAAGVINASGYTRLKVIAAQKKAIGEGKRKPGFVIEVSPEPPEQ